MATPLDIVTGALRSVGALAGGETPAPEEANDAFALLNDLVDQLSNEPGMLFCKQEVIHEITANQSVYTIGPGGNVGATIVGGIFSNSATLNVTSLSGALSVGQMVSGSYATGGTLTSLVTATRGLGYLTAPALSFSGGGGTGAAATGTLTAVGRQGLIFGAGYTSGDILTAVGGVFTRPAKFLYVNPGQSVELIDGGQYTVVPGTPGVALGINTTGNVITNISFSGGTGAGLLAALYWGLGDPIITNAGSGYTSAPTCTPVGGSPFTAGTYAAGITTGSAGAVADGTVITSYGTGQGGNGVAALGTYNLNLSQPGGGPANLTTYSPRPLRINSGFVRINSTGGTLDYPIEVSNIENFERIGLKQMPGPWPRALYYQPSEPLGILTYFPSPSQGEMHLFCDMLFPRFQTLQDTIALPQGYVMALRWMLAEILMVEYPATAAAAEIRELIPRMAAGARAMIKRTNMQPPQQVTFDPILMSGRVNDAGFILHGGFQN